MSEIPKGVGTQRNESLHRKLKTYFNNRNFVNWPTGKALVATMLHGHNEQLGAQDPSPSTSIGEDTHTSHYFKKRAFPDQGYANIIV